MFSAFFKDFLVSTSFPLILLFSGLILSRKKRFYWFAFLLGAISVLFVIVGSLFAKALLQFITLSPLPYIFPLLGLVIFEELMKTLSYRVSLKLSLSHLSAVFATVCGFVIMENVLYVTSYQSSLILRNISSFFIHLLCLAFIALWHKQSRLIIGLSHAVVLHSLYNLVLLNFSFIILLPLFSIFFTLFILEAALCKNNSCPISQ